MLELYRLEDVCEILDSKRIPITSTERKSGVYPYYGANGLQDYVDNFIFDDELVLLAEDGGNFGSKIKPIAYRVSGKCWVNNHAHVLKPKPIINVDYLCYTLMFYDTTGIVNGATRQKLTQSAMRKMMIPMRSIDEQLKIVKELSALTNLISKHKQKLTTLDELVKSQFIEMFGDLNQWEKKMLPEIADMKIGLTYKPADVTEKNGMIVLRSSNIQNGELCFDDIVRVNKKVKDTLMVKNGDILMCSRNGSARLVGKSTIIKDLPEPMTFGAFMTIIRSPYSFYLQNFFATLYYKSQLTCTSSTTVNQITINMLNKIIVPLPPIDLQNKFAEIVKLTDKLKFTIKESIKRLELCYQSLMQKYFN